MFGGTLLVPSPLEAELEFLADQPRGVMDAKPSAPTARDEEEENIEDEEED